MEKFFLGRKSYSGNGKFISLFETENVGTIKNIFHSPLNAEYICDYCCLFVFLALQLIVVEFSQPGSGL
jgi:hypothetical protein